MRKWAIGIVGIAALLGGLLAFVSVLQYYDLLKGSLAAPSFCNISAAFNCDLVAASSYATLWGQPVAGWGLLYFLVQFLCALYAFTGGPHADRGATRACGLVCALAALPYSIFLLVVMATRLKTFCLSCIGIDLAQLVILLGWWLARRRDAEDRRRSLARRLPAHAGAALAVAGIGAIFLASATDAAYKAAKVPKLSAGRIAEAVAAFRRGSLHDIAVDAATRPVWGNPDAAVTVIEFSDYQCPFCRVAAAELPSALAEFQGQVRLIPMHYPLDGTCNSAIQQAAHPLSCLAARVAICAHKAGKFWPVHEGLFARQEKLTRELVMQLGEAEVGPGLTQCLSDPATEAALQEDIRLAQHINVTGTPTVLVNRRRAQHWRPREVFRAIIRSELEQK
ncbi:MAG: thioredoxin domain-containing protein [Deltaproteobacteria bacterium]|nr:thioredoxin domain-containing protein [Deltaproteobacteria bacterium]